MSIKKDGIMVILSSPSGAGKTTLVKLLSEKNNFHISVSHTTREPRSSEIHNQDYYFVDQEKFQKLIKNEEFLEYAKVFNHYYGTTRTPVIEKLEKGKNVVFDIDWQGADQIKNKKLNYKLITFFILPPSKEVLFERLSNRDMKDKLIVEERMKEFGRDVLHWINYNYVIVNDNLNDCYSKINNLIEAEISNGSKDYDKEYIRKHVNKLTS
ncbi:guanylate kinase [Candidatus Pelagibacter sp.]|nr:guanylate kinase [Candidatus Pelagibacter sp.]